MTSEAWRTAIVHEGDALWRLALLVTGDPKAAQAMLVRSFIAVYASTSPPAEILPTLVHTLLHQRQRVRSDSRFRLPPALAQLSASDRLLLGLWLDRSLGGPRLVTLTGLSPTTLLNRLLAILLAMLPRHDAAHTTAGRSDLNAWLARSLDLTTAYNAPPGAAAEVTTAPQTDWTVAVERLRMTVQNAVDQQRLPLTCRAAIEAALNRHDDVDRRPWWRILALQRGLAVAALLVLLLLVIAPWAHAPASTATPAPAAARDLVEQALAAWSALPEDGTLRRQVWALDERQEEARAVQTDVWLAADSSRHRIEVRQGDRLVEWQLVDGSGRLLYATKPEYSACAWQDSSVLDQQIRVYTVPPDVVRTAQQARLQQGAYGLGYRTLQAALQSPDLRSLGTRAEDGRPVALLSYTEQPPSPSRSILLVIDLETRQLQAVRAVLNNGNQTSVQDLWRLETHAVQATSAPLAMPRWQQPVLEHDRLLDPTCPGLGPERVVSLRSATLYGWWWYLPSSLPPGTTRAAILSATPVDWSTLTTSAARAIFVGPDRWLSLSTSNFDDVDALPGVFRHGPWRVQLLEEDASSQAKLCRSRAAGADDPEFTANSRAACRPTFILSARGWTRAELLAVIDSLVPVTPQAWSRLDPVFLDAVPLASQTRAVFAKTFAALQPRQAGTLFTAVEQRWRVNPDRPVRQDPYYVPLEIVLPQRLQHQRWMVFADSQVIRHKHIATTPDGALILAEMDDGTQHYQYSGAEGQMQLEPHRPASWWRGAQPTSRADSILRLMLGYTLPVTVTDSDGLWLLEQRTEPTPDLRSTGLLGQSLPEGVWTDELPLGRIAQRILIDKDTGLLREASVVHIDGQGNETLLETVVVHARRYLDGSHAQDLLTFPQLPDDTVVVRYNADQTLSIDKASLDLQLPARTLGWNNDNIATVELEQRFDPSIFTTSSPDERLEQAAFGSLYDLDATGIVQVTHYRMPDDTLVIFRQGPRGLMRHKLRYQVSNDPGQTITWTSSRAIDVVIAGRQYTAWLLTGNLPTSLIIEADDMLLYVTTPDAAYLDGPLLDKLPALEWQDR